MFCRCKSASMRGLTASYRTVAAAGWWWWLSAKSANNAHGSRYNIVFLTSQLTQAGTHMNIGIIYVYLRLYQRTSRRVRFTRSLIYTSQPSQQTMIVITYVCTFYYVPTLSTFCSAHTHTHFCVVSLLSWQMSKQHILCTCIRTRRDNKKQDRDQTTWWTACERRTFDVIVGAYVFVCVCVCSNIRFVHESAHTPLGHGFLIQLLCELIAIWESESQSHNAPSRTQTHNNDTLKL